MKFRPCIDLHQGKVKQIIGSTLSDQDSGTLQTNFASDKPPSYYAEMYKRDGLVGGHVIKLGSGNDEAAVEALNAYPGGLQIGGGITSANAAYWLSQGASEVIVTSYVFKNGQVFEGRLQELTDAVGKENLVLDLSCRLRHGVYYVVTDRWQKFTDIAIDQESLHFFSKFCKEFLVHGVDVEGKCAGIDEQLVALLGGITPLPTTYAGGVKSIADLYRVKEIGRNRLDATIGSALDIFGGSGVAYSEAVDFNRKEEQQGQQDQA